MSGSFISVDLIGQQQITQALNKLLLQSNDLAPAFREIGEHLTESTQQRFVEHQTPDGEAWDPLSPKTLKTKKRKDRILTESGTLADTLNYQLNNNQLMFGTNLEYGAAHQFGREDVNLPAREFLGLSDDDQDEILVILQDHLK